MTRQPILGSDRLRRLWTRRFWLLAAVLGATTIYTGVTTIHDGNQRGLAARLITQATAMHAATLANARLERLALEAFAPMGPLAPSPSASTNGRRTIEALARRQRDGIACACRELLPVRRFFHYDGAAGEFSVAPVDNALDASNPPSDSVLAGLARAEWTAPRSVSNSSSRLIVDRRLGNESVIALVQRDDRGNALAVYGLLVKTAETFRALLSWSPHGSAIDSAGLTRLDSLSFEVRTGDGTPVYGSLGAGRFHGIVRLAGPLRGLVLTVAVAPSRIASPLMAPHSRIRLWNLGALMAATVLVVGMAVSSTRREILLARARSDFIAGVSHDLRMPLAQILIASETLTLRRERNEAERASLTSSIVREARRLMAVVDNVLLFSRSGAVDLRPVMRTVSVGKLFDEVVDAVRLAVDDAGQTIEVTPGPPASVLADQRLVRQALVNLVDNALKYGASGQRIRLAAEVDGAVVRLVVEDEGPGIPPVERERIFQPYARLAHDQVSERTGTGLGLAVVRQIAEACAGRVWIEGGRPRGARIVLELRAAVETAPFAAAPEIA